MTQESNAGLYTVPCDLNMDSIEKIYTELKEFLTTYSEITLDLTAVKNITTPGLQILIGLLQHGKNNNQKIIFKNFQDQAKQNLAELGIEIKIFE